MSHELKFKRPGGIELQVDLHSSGRYFVTLLHRTRRHDWRVLVSSSAVLASQCKLCECDGTWSLCATFDARFWLSADEARQLQETFGLDVQRASTRAAS